MAEKKKSLTQKGSSLLRMLGLGFLPNIAAASYQNPIFGGDKLKQKARVLTDLGQNPFITSQSI